MRLKICVISEICVRKPSPEKSVYICEICGTYSTLRGYLHRPNRSLLRKSVSNRLSRNPPTKFRAIPMNKKKLYKSLGLLDRIGCSNQSLRIKYVKKNRESK